MRSKVKMIEPGQNGLSHVEHQTVAAAVGASAVVGGGGVGGGGAVLVRQQLAGAVARRVHGALRGGEPVGPR